MRKVKHLKLEKRRNERETKLTCTPEQSAKRDLYCCGERFVASVEGFATVVGGVGGQDEAVKKIRVCETVGFDSWYGGREGDSGTDDDDRGANGGIHKCVSTIGDDDEDEHVMKMKNKREKKMKNKINTYLRMVHNYTR
ncbi:hypothetical protein A2U01_0001365 [Trifolium medium]|uniref:Uncharacterized protein n=1 Tax=Trifolium medium TaxID=97028 RepID=A0A392M038_9FABA|nr:hypothetical protein [Trifolium medium]